jgi:hypothetical protein
MRGNLFLACATVYTSIRLTLRVFLKYYILTYTIMSIMDKNGTGKESSDALFSCSPGLVFII